MTTTTFAGTAGRIVGTAVRQINWAEVGAIVLYGLQILIVLTLLAGRATRRAWDILPGLSEQLGRAYARLLLGVQPAPPQISAPIVTRHQLETMTCRQLMAVSVAQACSAALELAGPGARILRICREGDW